MSFVICAQFTGKAARYVAREESDLFLSDHGRWAPLEKAVRFDSRQSAQTALQEKWQHLRNSGNRSVILSVLEFHER